MTGSEAKEVMETIFEIYDLLQHQKEKSAFFEMGILYQKMSSIVSISECALRKSPSPSEDYY